MQTLWQDLRYGARMLFLKRHDNDNPTRWDLANCIGGDIANTSERAAQGNKLFSGLQQLGRSIRTAYPDQYFRSPIYPPCLVENNAGIISHDVRISGAAADQEFLDVGVHFSLLRRGEGAVIMTGGQRVSHHIGRAVRLPDHASRVCGSPGTLRTEPQNVILDDQYRQRRDQSYDGVMVKREFIRRVAELIEIGSEPYILTNDFRQSLCLLPL